ncbi:MAG: ttcA [Chlamydiales bacterium]|jgi:tRNA(Ile)-lysidine synthase TilS/MesJ|nr:ttcA [Chlamydiales bacterium]
MDDLSTFELSLPIARPPWTGLGKRLERLCRKALYDFELLPPTDEKIVIALSGGKDSLCLLFLLKAIAGRGFPNWNIHAVHVHGPYSCGASIDKSFLSGICKELQVPLILKESTQQLETLECYSCSRERRSLIFNAAKEIGASTIAFGHHRDDSIQTLLMNLLYKGEFAANLPKVPMHKYGVTIVRPLIYITEQDIRNLAKQYGFARITCQCPVGQNSMRKQTEKLITQLEGTFPNARENLASAGLHYGSNKAASI